MVNIDYRMTYRQLARLLNNLSQSQLDCDVCIDFTTTDENINTNGISLIQFAIASEHHQTLVRNQPIFLLVKGKPSKCTEKEYLEYLNLLKAENAFSEIV